MALFNYYPSNPKKLDYKLEKKIFIHSLILPAFFVLAFWLVEIIEFTTGLNFSGFGVYPRHLKGLPGILFSPFLHSDFNHLISNSIPFFILFFVLIYFYRKLSYRIFFQLYLLAGLFVWLAGREAWHIGASGVVYALAAFHFVSGIIRNDVRLLTISVIVVFLYGGMVWGMFPFDPKISWEGHLWGAVSGVALAIYYRKYLIRRDTYDWEDEEDEEEEEEIDQSQLQSQFEKKEKIDRAQSGLEEKGKEQIQLLDKKEEENKEEFLEKKTQNSKGFVSFSNTNHTGQY